MTFNPNTDIDPAWVVSNPNEWPAWASGGDPGTLLLGPPSPIPRCGGGPGITVIPAWERKRQEQECQWLPDVPPGPPLPPGALAITAGSTGVPLSVGTEPNPFLLILFSVANEPTNTWRQLLDLPNVAPNYDSVSVTATYTATQVTFSWDRPLTVGSVTWDLIDGQYFGGPGMLSQSATGWFMPGTGTMLCQSFKDSRHGPRPFPRGGLHGRAAVRPIRSY